MSNKVKRTEQEWRALLSDDEYRICREKGTERAFTGQFWESDDKQGHYLCRCCGEALFDTDAKYDSGSGWPSFFQALTENSISEHEDNSLAMSRTEITCSNCDSHLGHVFSDGPAPTGLRYCVNSASLSFDKSDDEREE